MEINNPTVLVGLPRSGSTLLTRILNESPSHYVLNDLYVLQKVDKQQSWKKFDNVEHAKEIKTLLTSMVRHRSAVHSPKGIANSAEMDSEQLDSALSAISDLWPTKSGHAVDGNWAALIEAVISTAGRVLGKPGWGWNTPQDYHHIDRIMSEWPNARIVFMMRDPRSMLKSYKYYPKRPAADRYHPLAQSLAWRNAARAWSKYSEQYPNNILLIKYENLVEDTATEIQRINAFLPSNIPESLDLAILGSNSSFTPEKKQLRILSPLEMWLSDSVLFRERAFLGFSYERQTFSFSGLLSLLKTSWRFSCHYGLLIATDPDIRRRISNLWRGK